MSGNQKREFLSPDICPCFMTKTMTLNTEYRRSPFEDRFTADTAVFHCVRTMGAQGPDDDDVIPETCRPGRACYSDIEDIN